MPDKLTELFDTFKLTNPDATEFQIFQAGLTAGALSMRTRAMALVIGKDINFIKNKIGQLSDIPD